jgi:hypothetical protein
LRKNFKDEILIFNFDSYSLNLIALFYKKKATMKSYKVANAEPDRGFKNNIKLIKGLFNSKLTSI